MTQLLVVLAMLGAVSAPGTSREATPCPCLYEGVSFKQFCDERRKRFQEYCACQR